MDTYIGGALDSKIAHFLGKQTAKFPDLQYSRRREKEYVFAADFKAFYARLGRELYVKNTTR